MTSTRLVTNLGHLNEAVDLIPLRETTLEH